MKRVLVIGAMAATLAVSPGVSFAQGRGEFPEQPGGNVQRGCVAVFLSESNAVSGRASEVQNERARAMNEARFIDACFPATP